MRDDEHLKLNRPFEKNVGRWSKNWFDIFGIWLGKALTLYKSNIPLLLATSIIFFLGTLLSCGLLLGPLMMGFAIITLRLSDNTLPKPTPRDIFVPFDSIREPPSNSIFWHSFLYGICFILAVGIGYSLFFFSFLSGFIAGIIAYVYLLLVHPFFMFGIWFIADQRYDFLSALSTNIQQVKQAPLHFLAFSSVVLVLQLAGFTVIYVGLIFSSPFYFCALTAGYRENYPQKGLLEKIARDRT